MQLLLRHRLHMGAPLADGKPGPFKSASLLCAGKTVEIRRSEAGGDKGKGSTAKDLERLFLIAQEDRHRPRIGLSPLPMPVPPPPPPSEYALQTPLTLKDQPSSGMRRHVSATPEL